LKTLGWILTAAILAVVGIVLFLERNAIMALLPGTANAQTGGNQQGTNSGQGGTLAVSVSNDTWSITNGTPNGNFTVVENVGGFEDSYAYKFGPQGSDTRSFNTGGQPKGTSGKLTVTDSSSGKTATCTFTV